MGSETMPPRWAVRAYCQRCAQGERVKIWKEGCFPGGIWSLVNNKNPFTRRVEHGVFLRGHRIEDYIHMDGWDMPATSGELSSLLGVTEEFIVDCMHRLPTPESQFKFYPSGHRKLYPGDSKAIIKIAFGIAEECLTPHPQNGTSACSHTDLQEDAPLPIDVVVEVPAALAASLILTHSPEPVMSPWPTFKVIVMPALDWLVSVNCRIESGFATPVSVNRTSGDDVMFSDMPREVARHIDNLVQGTCILYSDESPRSLRAVKSLTSASATPHSGGVIRLDRKISVNLIDLATMAMNGMELPRGHTVSRDGKTVYFVRGHWVNQRCGPAGRDRRLQWRKPHWSSCIRSVLYKTTTEGSGA